jgi:hypothetical protein
MRKKSLVRDITVQPNECEEFILISVRLLTSLKTEIDALRAQCGLPSRVWEAPKADV